MDGEGRGTGRRRSHTETAPYRVTSVWYAQQWQDGKRKLKKIGDYPHIPLAEARELFTRDFATAINKDPPSRCRAIRGRAPWDLFDAYCDHLEAAGKASHKERVKVFGEDSRHAGA